MVGIERSVPRVLLFLVGRDIERLGSVVRSVVGIVKEVGAAFRVGQKKQRGEDNSRLKDRPQRDSKNTPCILDPV